MQHPAGTIIPVKLNGEEFPTIIDEKGAQRFIKNRIVQRLMDHFPGGMNQLSIDYQEGRFTQHEYMLFCISLGYSVCGFGDLSAFEDIEIDNPLWDELEKN
jgi:hypothetical protein